MYRNVSFRVLPEEQINTFPESAQPKERPDNPIIEVSRILWYYLYDCGLGLPIVRVSVDHGTAFDQAGSGQASPSSLINAIGCAARLAAK